MSLKDGSSILVVLSLPERLPKCFDSQEDVSRFDFMQLIALRDRKSLMLRDFDDFELISALVTRTTLHNLVPSHVKEYLRLKMLVEYGVDSFGWSESNGKIVTHRACQAKHVKNTVKRTKIAMFMKQVVCRFKLIDSRSKPDLKAILTCLPETTFHQEDQYIENDGFWRRRVINKRAQKQWLRVANSLDIIELSLFASDLEKIARTSLEKERRKYDIVTDEKSKRIKLRVRKKKEMTILEISEAIGIDVKELKQMNPELFRQDIKISGGKEITIGTKGNENVYFVLSDHDLYKHQEYSCDIIRKWLDGPSTTLAIQVPTRGGKSHIALNETERVVFETGKRVLIVVPQILVLKEFEKCVETHFKKLYLHTSFLFTDFEGNVQDLKQKKCIVAVMNSVQLHLNCLGEFHLVILDEAHHYDLSKAARFGVDETKHWELHKVCVLCSMCSMCSMCSSANTFV